MTHLIGGLFGLLGLVCTIIILVDAFRNSVVKCFFCCICGLYFIWYAFFEFQHENKLLIVIGSLLGSGVGGALAFLNK
jgi:hypothetical protein